MADLAHGQLRLPVPRAFTERPRLPPLARLPNPPSVSSTSTDPSRARPSLAAVDFGCFLTGVTGMQLQQCHLVDPVRARKHESKEDLLTRKLKVEMHLSELLGRYVALESTQNLIYLNSHLHSQLHSYGIFALTPSCECMRDLVRVLGAANNAWDKSVEETGAGLRRIDYNSPVFTSLQWDIAILVPLHFLPHGEPLPIATFELRSTAGSDDTALPLENSPHTSHSEAAQPPNSMTPASTDPRWRSWKMAGLELHPSDDPSGPRLAPFTHESRRSPNDTLDPFMFVLDAALKVRHHRMVYPGLAMGSHSQTLADLVLKLWDLIYYVPERLKIPSSAPSKRKRQESADDDDGSARSPKPSPRSSSRPDANNPGPASGSALSQAGRSSAGKSGGGQEGVVSEGEGPEDVESDGGQWESRWGDDEEDMAWDRGLTAAETVEVAEKLDRGKLSLEERTELATMLLTDNQVPLRIPGL